jgi:hypothetical protein
VAVAVASTSVVAAGQVAFSLALLRQLATNQSLWALVAQRAPQATHPGLLEAVPRLLLQQAAGAAAAQSVLRAALMAARAGVSGLSLPELVGLGFPDRGTMAVESPDQVRLSDREAVAALLPQVLAVRVLMVVLVALVFHQLSLEHPLLTQAVVEEEGKTRELSHQVASVEVEAVDL